MGLEVCYIDNQWRRSRGTHYSTVCIDSPIHLKGEYSSDIKGLLQNGRIGCSFEKRSSCASFEEVVVRTYAQAPNRWHSD